VKIGQQAKIEGLGSLRGAFEATGSPRWIMYAIKKHGLDAKQNFRLEVDFTGDTVKGGLQSTEVALAEGAVDFIDTDWLSIARCRRHGMKVVGVCPYGRIMGGLVVPRDSSIQILEDLHGRRIGVVHRNDKNWAVVRAVCLRRYGFDPQDTGTVEECFSKTALLRSLEEGGVDAAVLYWHLIPGLTVTNRYRQVCDVLDLLPELGIGRSPTTFFTFREEVVERSPDLVRAFVAAFREAVALMRGSDDIWKEIFKTLLHERDGALLRLLRKKWERRITTVWDESMIDDLHRLFGEMRRLGEPGQLALDRFPEGTFTAAFMH
jgi:NitT/TauT family transport system substrate-binding protein